ncbi:ABC transporter substrate-binding protein [Rhodohalobacter sp.]|uniref:ABC transporter substrate-binding protein n=1 Tax=Rhodohalobacter sp. TaxID=1974210 RepID=UPI002ACEE405|nr:ABC transporter substrate-binding protein [Rhodohalobacter sp.]MDZ7755702.1 ABC transporter substrate-binding protein [Rhodohalobacter sp.]
MNNTLSKKLLILLPLMILLYGCGTTDTVTVVEQSPESATAQDGDESTQPRDEFQQLRVGTLEPITNFDPLFADNLSTLRVIALIYDGLFKLNPEGEPEPALVSDYSVSEDGRQYELTINRDLYFHDSNVFGAGVGRRIQADDIRWAFERTAKSHVPPTASQLLMNISGYENYFIEQRTIYDESKRVLDRITGIEVVDAETIRITLKQPDDTFLHKLASPYLSIYPREAAQNSDNSLKNAPVGTGAYVLNSATEGEIVLSRKPSPRFTDQIEKYPVNRIDFVYQSSESEMFQSFARENIDWMPELGPQIKKQVTVDGYNLNAAYENQFTLVQNSAKRLTMIYVNQNSEQNMDYVKNQLSELNADQFTSTGTVSFEPFEASDADSLAETPSELYIPFTDNPFAKTLLTDINNSVFQPETKLAFLDIRAVTPETSLYSRWTDSFHYPFFNGRNYAGYWLSAESVIIGIHHSFIDGIVPSSVPWLLPLEGLTVDRPEQDAS